MAYPIYERPSAVIQFSKGRVTLHCVRSGKHWTDYLNERIILMQLILMIQYIENNCFSPDTTTITELYRSS